MDVLNPARKIILDSLRLGGARVWTLLLSVTATYTTAALLGPRDYGLLAAFALVPQLATYGSLGWDSAVTRELPHLRAIGGGLAVERARGTAYAAELGMAAVWLLVALVVAAVMPTPTGRTAVLLGGFSVLIGKITRLFAIDAFVDKDFAVQARVGVIVATSSAILQTVGAWAGGAVAAFAGVVAANAIGLVAYWRARGFHGPFVIDRAELWRLTRIGVPMALLGLVSGTTGATAYIERTFIGAQAGLTMLGLYVFAMNLNNYLIAFVGDFSRTWHPHLLEALARSTAQRHVEQWMVKPGLALSLVSALLATGLLAVVPIAVPLLLPDYVAVVPVLPIIFTAGLLNCLTYVPGNLLNSAMANRQTLYTGLWALAVAAFAGVLWMVLRFELGLAGLAAAAILPPLIVISVTIPLAYSYYTTGVRQAVFQTVRLIAPLVYVVVVHAVARQVALNGSAGWKAETGLAAVTLAVTLPPLAVMAWHTLDVPRLWRQQLQVS